MKEEYIVFISLQYKIIEIYNPVTGGVEVILFTSFDPENSKDYFYVSGIDITNFLNANKLQTIDNHISFRTIFEGYLQKSSVVNFKYSKHFSFKVFS